MSSLMRKVGHVGKQATKFMYLVRVHELGPVPPDCGPVTVIWTRGPRVMQFSAKAPTAGTGKITWDEEKEMVVTLYRKGQRGFDKKEAKFSIKEQRGSKLKKVGSIIIDLADYASLDGAPFTVDLPLNEKMKNGPKIKLTFTTRWCKNYSGQGDDVASQMTDMTDFSRLSVGAHSRSSDAHTEDQNLDDFPELNDDFVTGGGHPGGHDPHNEVVRAGGLEESAAAAAIGASAATIGGPSSSASSSSASASSGQLSKLQRENAELRSQVARLTSENAQATGGSARITELEETVADLQSKLDDAEEEWTKNRSEIDALTEERDSLKTDLEAAKEKNVEVARREARSGTVVPMPQGGSDSNHASAAAAAAAAAAVGATAASDDKGEDQAEVIALRASVRALEVEKEALESAKSELEEENRALEEIVEPLQEENDNLADKVTELKKELEAVVARSTDGDEKEVKIQELRAENDTITDEKLAAENRVRELEEELAMVKDNMADLQKTQNNLASELGQMRGRKGSTDQHVPVPHETRAKIRNLESEVARLRQQEAAVEEITGQLIAAKLELAEVTGDKYVLEQQCKNLKRDVDKYKQRAGKLGTQVAQLEVKVESARSR